MQKGLVQSDGRVDPFSTTPIPTYTVPSTVQHRVRRAKAAPAAHATLTHVLSGRARAPAPAGQGSTSKPSLTDPNLAGQPPARGPRNGLRGRSAANPRRDRVPLPASAAARRAHAHRPCLWWVEADAKANRRCRQPQRVPPPRGSPARAIEARHRAAARQERRSTLT